MVWRPKMRESFPDGLPLAMLVRAEQRAHKLDRMIEDLKELLRLEQLRAEQAQQK